MRWLWREQLQKQGQTISPTLDGVLDKLLQDLPDARYQTAAEAMAALEFEEREAQRLEAEKRSREEAARAAAEQQLREETRRLQRELRESQSDRADLARQLEIEKRDRSDLQIRFDEQSLLLEREKRDRADLARQLEKEKRDRSDLARQLENLQSRFDEQGSQLEQEKRQRQVLQNFLDQQGLQLEMERRDRSDLQIQLETEKRDRFDLQNRFDRQSSQLETERRDRQDLERRLARAEGKAGNHGWFGKLFNPQPATSQTTSSVLLKSARGIYYTLLRDLLAAGKWEAADKETSQRMLQVMGKQHWTTVVGKDIHNFPCSDLRTIDRLWLHYSNGRFGFSVQRHIYESLGGTREYNQESWEAFKEFIGWSKGGRHLNKYSYLYLIKKSVPQAYLPSTCNEILAEPYWGGWIESCGALFYRTKACSL